MSNHHKVIIAGSGLAALAAAARLNELGVKDIAIYAGGLGGTPYIAAINFVLPENPYGDTPELYAKDMLVAGYNIGNKELVNEMAANTLKGYELLCRWGVTFAHNEDGSIKLRHVSGHTYPRSLCQTTNLIGVEIEKVMLKKLEEAGIEFHRKTQVVDLLKNSEGKIEGFTVIEKGGEPYNVYAPVVVASWGGVGNLLGTSTYPDDVKGNTLGMAKNAGAELVDLEFIEFEPMVMMSPAGAVGEPCPTAMLGEGGYLLNSEGERFLLEVRPQGEAGAPKSLINHEIWKQVAKGKGNPHGGIWVDLRHVDVKILKAYPWFYDRLMNNGCDPNKELLEVGPMPHSFSGGIRVDRNYESNVKGLYAIGEACGGIHGACRCAGNAASQATLSGLLCAEGIMRTGELDRAISERPVAYKQNDSVRAKYLDELQKIAGHALGVYRNGKDLEEALNSTQKILDAPEVSGDDLTSQTALAINLILKAALNRKESRGTHNRTDYPASDPAYEKEFVF
ncbi:MAG: FAD-binding protein [Synergistaceae bacterium]|nr:FAD-binding protein [Synergistaceae bacterium]